MYISNFCLVSDSCDRSSHDSRDCVCPVHLVSPVPLHYTFIFVEVVKLSKQIIFTKTF